MTRNQAEAAAREESVNSSRQPRAQPWLVGSADTHKESEAERGRERQGRPGGHWEPPACPEIVKQMVISPARLSTLSIPTVVP